MKYIKSYKPKLPKRGDYIVVNPINVIYNVDELKEFIGNTIGRVSYIYDVVLNKDGEPSIYPEKNMKGDKTIKEMTIQFFNIPERIISWFESGKYAGKINYYLRFNVTDIVDFAKTPEELEYILKSNKYNL